MFLQTMDENNDDFYIGPPEGQNSNQPSVATNCPHCPNEYFNLLSPMISDKSKLNDYNFREASLHVYDALQTKYCECKKDHQNLQFCPDYFLQCFDLIQRLLFSFDLEIGIDFPMQIANFHYSLEFFWHSCTHCQKIIYIV